MSTEIRKALIVVRTYPTPARNGVEVSCTAAVTEQGQWLRLFPVPYRFLDKDQRFRKYQWVEVKVKKASDARPESYKLQNPDPIRILTEPLSSTNGWQARKKLVFPLKKHCLCCIQQTQKEHGHPTLGIFRPKNIHRLIIEEDDADWTGEQIHILRQARLFGGGPKVELEKVPYKFLYEFTCDHESCSGHRLSCTDWEMGQSWRRWSDKYGKRWMEKFRQRYDRDMIQKNDTHFFVGTVHQHPHRWIIVGLFYPPKQSNRNLFDMEC